MIAAIVDERVTEVLKLKLDGYSTAQIKELTKHWKVTERTINNYISRATEKLTEINLANVEETRAVIITNLWELYRTNKDIKDIKECHRILNSIAKNSGLDKISINVNNKDDRVLKNLSDEELRAIVGTEVSDE